MKWLFDGPPDFIPSYPPQECMRSNSRSDVPGWLIGLGVALVVTTASYLIIYGGEVSALLTVLFALGGVGLSLFALSLLYRFVVAVETIAEKH